MSWYKFVVRDIHQQFGLRERLDAELRGDGLDDFARLRGQRGAVDEDPGAEFLVVEGVHELFHQVHGDGGFGGEFDVQRGQLDGRGRWCAGVETQFLSSITTTLVLNCTILRGEDEGGRAGRYSISLGFSPLQWFERKDSMEMLSSACDTS